MNSQIKSLVKMSVLAATLFASAGVHATPTSYKYFQGAFGDEVLPVDINDSGTIVWSGFGNGGLPGPCNSVGRGGTFIQQPPFQGPRVGSFVAGFGGDFCGVVVTDINNAGDMLGTAYRNGISVAAYWHGGVVYDLTDPSNSGLSFQADAGPKSISLDIADLDIVGLPGSLDPVHRAHTVLTNSRGDIVFGFIRLGNVLAQSEISASLATIGILRQIPEPTTLLLTAIGLFLVFSAPKSIRAR